MFSIYSKAFASFANKSIDVPGNCGIKDIILALKWIKANCTRFNGDPENITLFGHSSGSTTVHILMQTHITQGLFNKVILMAGYNMTLPTEPKLEYRLAKHLGFDGKEDDEMEVYNFLSQVEASELLNFDIFTVEEKMQYENIQIFPCIPRMEAYSSDSAVIFLDPVIAQRSTWTNSIPIMMGCTSNEALAFTNKFKDSEDKYIQFKLNPKYMLPSTFQSVGDEKLLREMGKRMQELHFGDRELTSKNYNCGVEVIMMLLLFKRFYNDIYAFSII